jgi:glycosyltransferase involved in cell wall biosynthesis
LALLRGRLDSITIEFLGEGPTLETVRASAKAAGLAERCVFRGRVTHEEVLAAMSHAAITVVPSRSEAFGLVNIESMAVGTPVIASAVGGIPEILRDGVDGYLVPPDRPAVLAERLLHVLESLSLRDSMSQSSRNRFLKLYEQCKVVTAQADWLDGIVSGNERSPAEIQKCPADESLRHAGRALG